MINSHPANASKSQKYPLETPNNLKDFLLPVVEFFGILVPGLIFMVAIIPAAIIPLLVLFKALYLYLHTELANHSLALKEVDYFYKIINEVIIVIMGGFSKTYGLLFLVFSYVAGHIFYRQDIKKPDLNSFEKTSRRYKKLGPASLHTYKQYKKLGIIKYKISFLLKKVKYFITGRRFPFSLKRDFVKRQHIINTYKDHAKFPYERLKKYMKDRGLDHLADRIIWGDEKDKYRYKTKHFISIMKIRLEFLFPRQYVKIQKNEAHVRLMSSTWYTLKVISYISLTSFIMGTLIYISTIFYLNFFTNKTSIRILYFLYFIFPTIATCITSYHLKSKIENFLHYQRIREIIFILEMSHFADMLRPDLDIFNFDPHKETKWPAQDGLYH